MAEKRLPDFVGPGLPAFPDKRLRTGSHEISNVYSATQSVSTGVETDSCIRKTGNNEMQKDSDDEDSYTEETKEYENQEGCDDDDDADRSLLYCILLSKDERIDLNSTDWYERLTDIRSTYKMKHRSREEDVLAIQSMTQTSNIVYIFGNEVMCSLLRIEFNEDDRVYNCLTFNKDYENFLKVTPTEVLRKCVPHMENIQEKIMSSSDISDIVLNFGLDFLRFNRIRRKYKKIYEDGLKILNLHHVVDMLDRGEFSGFKEYVDEIMKCEHKSLKSLNLNSLLGSYLIGRETGKEKALDNLALSHTKWNILVSILMSESYCLSLRSPWEELLTKHQSAFPLLRCGSRMLDSDIAELTDIHKVLNKENNSVKFISDDVRHQVMSYFVKNCLITDKDYENYIKLSSVDSLLEYVRPLWYEDYEIITWRDKVLFLPRILDDSFIQTLGIDVLRHVIVELNDFTIDRIETVREAVKKKLKLPYAVFHGISRKEFVEYVKKISKEKQASIQSLNLNSLFGSFLIGRDGPSSEVPEILALSQTKKSILVSILISESYSLSISTTWEEITRKLQSAFPLLKCDSKTLDSDITELKDISKVFNKENNSVRFISDDVRHQVMSYFVRNCLITDEDYENYIKLSSVDSLLEYVRPWWYMEDEFTHLNKYLFLPETLEDSFFQRLGLDVLHHPTISYGECYEETTETFREKVKDKLLSGDTNKDDKQTLSVMDFGGQCAYYACHQVYLSRRAFYLLVIDMSKSFNERIDRKFCDQEDTMFADWTYGEYILFWMKSVHMYCDETAPVILIGTHLDKTTGQTTDSFYNSIIKHLRFDKSLKEHLDRKRCFLVGFQSKDDPSLDDLSDLMFCIASIAKEDRWKETIPTDWALCESTLRYLREQNRQVISKADFQKNCFGNIREKYEQVPDILKLFHEIGVILNFKEDVLSETVIIDIQWY